MSPPPERELLPDSAARRLLERAGEIDSSSQTLENLRNAAREAGISEAAFEAALAEIRADVPQGAAVPPSQTRRRWPLIAAVATLIAGAGVMLSIVSIRVPVTSMTTEVPLGCLTITDAHQLIAPVLGRTTDASANVAGHTMRIRGAPQDVNAARTLIERATASTCSPGKATRKTP